MNIKVIGLAAVISLVVAIGFSYFAPYKEIVREIIKEQSKAPALGAIPGNEINSDCLFVNGAQNCYVRRVLDAATTTPCVIRTPAATSSLMSFGVNVTNATGSRVTLVLATSTLGSYSTTTSLTTLARFFLPASLYGSFRFMATSTAAEAGGTNEPLDRAAIIQPDTLLVLSAQGGTGGANSLTGSCRATFEVF